MKTEISGVIFQVVLMIVISYPLGRYIAKVYRGEKTILDFLRPIERWMFRLSGIDSQTPMSWKQFLKTLLILNFVWLVWGIVLLMAQGVLPLNPDGNAGQTWHQALNTCISFLVNCNLQHYSGESGLTYLTQIFVIMFFQFVTAATGMAAMAGVMRALAEKSAKSIGNFWNYLMLSITRILLPLSLIVGFILIVQGTPMTLCGKMKLTTLEGHTQMISQGPVAAIVAIKQLGTNGGGFFGTNSAHPLENPTYLSNMVECVSIMILPMAMAFAFGFYSRRRRLGYSIFGVMLTGYLISCAVNMQQETAGNPQLDGMGISQRHGSMEGKEVRIGSAATALWSATTTATSNGSVNGMHDSSMPGSQFIDMLNMQTNCWFGGVGVGWMNYFTFIIIAVFISGLMVGRTPEFLGKKIEAREMKIASAVALLHPFLILTGTALACYLFVHAPLFVTGEGGWIANPSYHGLSEMFYEFSSCAANNGSGMEGLVDNTPFWNISCAVVLLLGRYLPIIGQVAIAGILADKRYVPQGAGTLRTDTTTFAVMTFAVIFIVAALSFFPAHALSTIAEWLK